MTGLRDQLEGSNRTDINKIVAKMSQAREFGFAVLLLQETLEFFIPVLAVY